MKTGKATILGDYKIISNGGFAVTFMKNGSFILPNSKDMPAGTMYIIKNDSETYSEDPETAVKIIASNKNDIFDGVRSFDCFNLKQYECLTLLKRNEDSRWYII